MQAIFSVAHVPIEWEVVNVTPVKTSDGHVTIPAEAMASFRRTRVGLKGPLATPIGEGHVSLNLLLRRFAQPHRLQGVTKYLFLECSNYTLMFALQEASQAIQHLTRALTLCSSVKIPRENTAA